MPVEQKPSRAYRPGARPEVHVVTGQAALNRIAQAVNAEEVMAVIEARLRAEGIEYDR